MTEPKRKEVKVALPIEKLGCDIEIIVDEPFLMSLIRTMGMSGKLDIGFGERATRCLQSCERKRAAQRGGT